MKGDSNTDTPKPPVGARFSRIVLVGLVGAVVIGVAIYTRLSPRLPAGPLPKRGNDPCDIYLVGVRPDYTDELFSGRGRFLREDPPVNVVRTHWNADRIQREFIFEVPVSDSSFKIIRPVRIYLNGHQGYSVKPRVTTIKSAQSTRIVADASLPRLSMRSKSAYAKFRGGEPVTTVDINVRYYAGPRAPAEIRFSGPFMRGQTKTDDQGLGYVLKARPHSTHSESLAFTLEISTKQALQAQMQLIVYLADGDWKVPPCISMNTTEQGATRSYLVRELTLGQLTHVTLNERPWEKTFRQVAVRLPGHAKRTYAPFLDEVAQRLDRDAYSRSEAFALQYQSEFADPAQALRILDVTRGRALFPVSRAIQHGLRAKNLDPAEQERIRSILKGWLGTELEAHACTLGLWGGWPEFVQPSLDRLRWTQFLRLSDQAIANAFLCRENPTDEEFLQVAGFLSTRETKHNPTRRALIQFVHSHCHRPAALEAWRKMAECDKPWVWTHVIQAGPAFAALTGQAAVSETIRLRALALDVPLGAEMSPDLAARAYALIATWITPQLLQQDVEQFCRVFSALVRHGQAQRDTPVLVSYLEQQLKFWNNYREKVVYQTQRTPLRNHVGIEKTIKLLNRWHGVNLGGLGADLDRESDPKDHNWMKLIRAALDWAGANPG